MPKSIVYRGMDSTPVLEEFANKHLEKIEKLLENQRTPVVIQLVLEAFPNHAHSKVTLQVKTPDYDLFANHEGPEMYQEIDRVIDKMIQEIRRAKERFVSDHKIGGLPKGASELEREDLEGLEEE